MIQKSILLTLTGLKLIAQSQLRVFETRAMPEPVTRFGRKLYQFLGNHWKNIHTKFYQNQLTFVTQS